MSAAAQSMTPSISGAPATPLLQIEGLVREYRLPRESLFQTPPVLRALDGVDLQMAAGESVGIVGESGCGKSTLARTVVALESPSAGRVIFDGDDLFKLGRRDLLARRRDLQMVFQDPYGSLDPRHKVERVVAEPMEGLKTASMAERAERVAEALAQVGLRPADADRYPHEFSGGQRQRIAIARALITRPRLIVADEAVSALDVSVQSQVLNLMMDLQAAVGMGYLFISHDLGVVGHVTDRVAVMYLGRVVETGRTAEIFHNPAHPYTRTLLAAVPVPDPARSRRRRARQTADQGPALTPQASGQSRPACAFMPRCGRATDICGTERPELRPVDGGRLAACHHV
ncbi:ABC transporter ATP-binding protein [Tistrella bauzanensis]|uniref:ABC transporter ATP-binding protein n=1 Tax=Tistrella bauzanensis TaxID=657419 RepID=A0ABQ1J2X4_9PROT|nr:oligopeptide/dipeptide ABC transporter ATP-binding protein [Tistrella bauzanensis]GGB56537.1 ABC transporter ATP-binding protein [Tistrella bauzanensis]